MMKDKLRFRRHVSSMNRSAGRCIHFACICAAGGSAHVGEELVQAKGVRLGRVPLELHRLPVGRRLRRRAVVHALEALVGAEAPRVLLVAAPCSRTRSACHQQMSKFGSSHVSIVSADSITPAAMPPASAPQGCQIRRASRR
jgi:hypothetical protein